MASLLYPKLVSFAFNFGWILGVTPKRLLWTSGSDAEPAKGPKLWQYGLPLLMLGVNFILIFTYLWEAVETIDGWTASVLILSSALYINWWLADALRRTYFIFQYRKVEQFFHQIGQLQREWSCVSGVGNRKMSSSSTRLTMRLITAYLASCCFWLVLDQFLNTFIGSLSSIWKGLCIDVITFSSKLLANSFIFVGGLQLLKAYERIVEQFKNTGTGIQPFVTSGNGDNQMQIRQREEQAAWTGLITSFQKIQDCFKLFNEISGFLLIVTVGESVTYLVFQIYRTTDQLTKLGVSQQPTYDYIVLLVLSGIIFEAILSIYLIVRTGEQFKQKMIMTKEEMCLAKCQRQIASHVITQPGSIFLSWGSSFLPSQQDLATDLIVTWEWNLTGVGLFKANNRLLTRLVGVILTYFMFMIQLKISENTAVLMQ